MWKGEKAGYSAKHYRVYTAKGPAKKCSKCDSTQNVHWAQTGVRTYKEMCRSCHAKYDNAQRNLR